jgi:hypothetical protein
VRCGHLLLGNCRGLALLATDNEGNLDRCLLTESLDGFLELRALGRALCIVFLKEMSVLVALCMSLSRRLTLGSLSTLGIWKVARVATDALPASDTDGAEALERVRGERVAAIVRIVCCQITTNLQPEQMRFNLRKIDRAW